MQRPAVFYYLGDGGLRVQHQVAERSLENPSELSRETGVVGDGSGARNLGRWFSLNYPI